MGYSWVWMEEVWKTLNWLHLPHRVVLWRCYSQFRFCCQNPSTFEKFAFSCQKSMMFLSQLRTNCYSISGRRKLSFKHEKLSNFSPCFILGHWRATMTATHGNASAHPCKCENNLASCIFRKFTLKNDLIEPTKFSRMNKKNRILHTLWKSKPVSDCYQL